MKRYRYHRGHLDSAIDAARRMIADSGGERFIYATAYGFTIEREPAPFGQQCVKVTATGTETIKARWERVDA